MDPSPSDTTIFGASNYSGFTFTWPSSSLRSPFHTPGAGLSQDIDNFGGFSAPPTFGTSISIEYCAPSSLFGNPSRQLLFHPRDHDEDAMTFDHEEPLGKRKGDYMSDDEEDGQRFKLRRTPLSHRCSITAPSDSCETKKRPQDQEEQRRFGHLPVYQFPKLYRRANQGYKKRQSKIHASPLRQEILSNMRELKQRHCMFQNAALYDDDEQLERNVIAGIKVANALLQSFKDLKKL